MRFLTYAFILLPLLRIDAAAAEAPTPPKLVITKAQADALFHGKKARMLIGYQATKKIAWREATEDEEIVETSVPLYLVDFTAATPSCALVVADAKACIGDPFISPDGTRVAYRTTKGVFVARLAAGAPEATLVSADGFDQRWWIHPTTGDEYLLMASTRGGNESSMAGKTSLQKLKKGTCQPEGVPTTLIGDAAYRSGRSPDGAYICSAQPGLAQAQLTPADATANAAVKVLFTNARKCNGSVSQDPKQPSYFLWEDTSHTVIFYDPADHSKTIPVPPGYQHQQWCEWSTHPDFITTSPCQPDDSSDHKLHDALIWQWSTKSWTKVSEGAGPTHLWVER
ncbi:MAG: hypothetical protein H0W72_02025 [Planctomycetes bacterium]|nr:hypothetical protein [Planctomycetota bacterium]